MRIVTAEQEWTAALDAYPQRDFYFTWDYHQMEAERLSGKPCLLVFDGKDINVALPLIIREIPGTELTDATSVYGYTGPLVSGQPAPTPDFESELRTTLAKMQVVSVFSRLHPVLDYGWAVAGLGDVADAGQTVSIDLTANDDEQWRQYRANLRRDIKALRQSDVEAGEAAKPEDMERFVRIYNDTMLRRGAGHSYFISSELVQALQASHQFDARLFKCDLNGQMICGGIFIRCGDILQYHWSGTDAEHIRLAPTKLMLDFVRHWASDAGLSVFHLGGGVGGEVDSLFRFKKGFSKRVHDFRLWRWIVREGDYAELCRKRDSGYSGHDLSAGFFPFYRKPD